MSKKDNRTTFFVAVGTFVGLSLVSLVAWSLTRPPAPQPAVQQQQAAVAPAENHDDHDHDTFERIAFDDFKKMYDAGEVTIIDVRSMDQFLASHIPGSLHIPVTRVEGEIPYLPKGKLVVTYCTCPAEESSGVAAAILVKGGVPTKALVGGMDEWTRRGFPIQTGVK
ncbi:MAG: rhodanese-like domain-containing protein [Thermoanaerobaculia bacterium]